jgi:hypothetical protein
VSTTQELVERLLRVHYATLDWADDFRRIGNADGETSEKARAELLKAAASRIEEMDAENKRLREALKPFAYCSGGLTNRDYDARIVAWIGEPEPEGVGAYGLHAADFRRAARALHGEAS